jgi:peptidoglycan hydrolase CwlO-like protein
VAGVREASSLRALLGDRERELAALKDQHSQTKGALAQAQAVQAEAEASLAYLRNTRRYRLASRVAAPLDSLRERHSLQRGVPVDLGRSAPGLDQGTHGRD